MEIKVKKRTDLKEYFRKKNVLTERNVADFIDAGLNQYEDGIFKPPNDPLCIQAVTQDRKPVLNLYESFSDATAVCSLGLAGGIGNKGFAIVEGNVAADQEPTRLFVQLGTGYVGVGTAEPSHRLDVKGSFEAESADIGGAMCVRATLGVGMAVNVDGVATLSKTITVKATATIDKALTVQGAATVAKTLNAKDTAALQALEAKDTATVQALDAKDTTSIDKALTVGDKATLQALTVKDTVTISKTLSVKDTATLSKALTVGDGASISKALTVHGSATIAKALSVKNTATVANTLTVKGAATIDRALRVNETTTLQALKAKDSVAVTNALKINDTATIDKALRVNDAATIDKALKVNDAATVTNALMVNDAATIDQMLTVHAAVTVNQMLIVTATASVNALEVNATATIEKALTVNDESTVEKTLTVHDAATIAKTLKALDTVNVGGNLSASSAAISDTLLVGSLTLGGCNVTKIVSAISEDSADSGSLPTEVAITKYVDDVKKKGDDKLDQKIQGLKDDVDLAKKIFNDGQKLAVELQDSDFDYIRSNVNFKEATLAQNARDDRLQSRVKDVETDLRSASTRLTDRSAAIDALISKADISKTTKAAIPKTDDITKGKPEDFVSIKAFKAVLTAGIAKYLSAGLLPATGLPQGALMPWKGYSDQIPKGWVPCDGRDGTRDFSISESDEQAARVGKYRFYYDGFVAWKAWQYKKKYYIGDGKTQYDSELDNDKKFQALLKNNSGEWPSAEGYADTKQLRYYERVLLMYQG